MGRLPSELYYHILDVVFASCPSVHLKHCCELGTFLSENPPRGSVFSWADITNCSLVNRQFRRYTIPQIFHTVFLATPHDLIELDEILQRLEATQSYGPGSATSLIKALSITYNDDIPGPSCMVPKAIIEGLSWSVKDAYLHYTNVPVPPEVYFYNHWLGFPAPFRQIVELGSSGPSRPLRSLSFINISFPARTLNRVLSPYLHRLELRIGGHHGWIVNDDPGAWLAAFWMEGPRQYASFGTAAESPGEKKPPIDFNLKTLTIDTCHSLDDAIAYLIPGKADAAEVPFTPRFPHLKEVIWPDMRLGAPARLVLDLKKLEGLDLSCHQMAVSTISPVGRRLGVYQSFRHVSHMNFIQPLEPGSSSLVIPSILEAVLVASTVPLDKFEILTVSFTLAALPARTPPGRRHLRSEAPIDLSSIREALDWNTMAWVIRDHFGQFPNWRMLVFDFRQLNCIRSLSSQSLSSAIRGWLRLDGDDQDRISPVVKIAGV